MRVWKATVLAGSLCLCLASSAVAAEKSVRLDAYRKAKLTTGHEIVLEVVPRDGDAWSRLALRICGDATAWRSLAELNGRGQNLLRGVPIDVPFEMVRPEMRVEIIRALFPRDARHIDGWIHEIVSEAGPEGESLWRIAEWFTGSGENYASIRSANPGITLSTRVTQRILVPNRVLVDEFRGEATESEERLTSAGAIVPDDATSDSELLLYESSGSTRHAVYRLKEGEAIYSSVAVRFTGRVHAQDVNEVVGEIVRFNGIDDVSRLPVGYPVRIPLDLLTPQFRPLDDPLRVEWERLRMQRSLRASSVEANRLEGVHVIIDPGHGGRDVGATFHDLYEAVYVYDIACRLKTILEKETGATVWITTRSNALGYDVPGRDLLGKKTDQVLLTTPSYGLDDPVVGVNLRWYLSNAIFRKVVHETDPEKVVFLSIHADSLHPSLRGAMVYIPGERHVRDLKFQKRDEVYLARHEVKEQPVVSHTVEEAIRAEALSNKFAESLMNTFRREGLGVHPFDPIREHVVREKKEWVPAVIRYNKVPTRVLVEVCNLGNQKDREQLTTQRWRGQVAQALADGILQHFRRPSPAVEPSAVTAAR